MAKTKPFSIRLTAAELAVLKASAGTRGPSAFAREAVLAAVALRRMAPGHKRRDALHRSLALVQIRIIDLTERLGINGPPTAGMVPAQGEPPGLAEVREAIHDLVAAVLSLGERASAATDITE